MKYLNFLIKDNPIKCNYFYDNRNHLIIFLSNLNNK